MRKILNFGSPVQHFFSGDIQIFGLTFEALPVARHLAKFHCDRSRELGDLGPRPKWDYLHELCRVRDVSDAVDSAHNDVSRGSRIDV